MCGAGPHPGGDLFRSLCKLADRFVQCEDDKAARQIGSILSLLAFYATKPNDRDFRYSFGSFVMDLAINDEANARAAAPDSHVPYGRLLCSRERTSYEVSPTNA